MKMSKTAQDFTQAHSSVIAGLALVGVLMLVGSFILSKNLVDSIRFNARVLSAKGRVADVLEQNVALLPELQSGYQALQSAGPTPETVLEALPTEVDFPGFASSIELIANISGTRLTLVAPLDLSVVAGVTTEAPAGVPSVAQPTTFLVTVDGSYSSVTTFISNLEKSLRPVVVDAIEMQGGGSSVSADLQVTTFYQLPVSVEVKTETLHEKE